MSAWDEFLTVDNFRLAWNRVIRSSHGDAKDRLALRVFNLNLERNLALLIERITNDTYQPFSAPKVYQPKRAGTVRPIPILTVADRVVYQALGNVIADRVNPELQVFVDQQVYAHVYAGPQRNVMLERWRIQYRKFMRALERAWARNNRWVVQVDIASFYDSIDHMLLINRIQQWLTDDNLLTLLQNCLRAWSPHLVGEYLNIGLPQGYETSDFLSTLFLYPVDLQLCKRGYDDKYRRYVDDIRLFLPTEDKAKRALIELDIALKSIGLILQTGKIAIERVDQIDSQRGSSWGLLSLVGDPFIIGAKDVIRVIQK